MTVQPMLPRLSRRQFFATALCVTATADSVTAQARGFHVRGTLSANESEQQEGYFALGNEFALVARQHSQVHDDLRNLVGSEIAVTVHPL